jgi:hypothetical protein
MVDLLALTSLEKLLFILKILVIFLTKQANSVRRSTVLRLPPQLVFPAFSNSKSATQKNKFGIKD